jgi:hypothetical protein
LTLETRGEKKTGTKSCFLSWAQLSICYTAESLRRSGEVPRLPRPPRCSFPSHCQHQTERGDNTLRFIPHLRKSVLTKGAFQPCICIIFGRRSSGSGYIAGSLSCMVYGKVGETSPTSTSHGCIDLSKPHPIRNLGSVSVPFGSMAETTPSRHICHCGKSFIRKEHLRRHQASHTGRSFQCSVCGRSFTRR